MQSRVPFRVLGVNFRTASQYKRYRVYITRTHGFMQGGSSGRGLNINVGIFLNQITYQAFVSLPCGKVQRSETVRPPQIKIGVSYRRGQIVMYGVIRNGTRKY